VGSVTFRNSEHQGVRRVVVDDFGEGSITIQPNARLDVVACSINTADEEYLNSVQVRQDGDTLRLTFPHAFGRTEPTHLRLDVPEDLEYAIRAGSADVTIRATIARSKINTGSGDISVGQAFDLECTTGSGDISVAVADGSAARLSSGSGHVIITEARCPVTARSGSGDVTIKSVQRSEVQANSGSGDIAVASTTGSVDLRSASGSLTIGIADQLAAWLDLHSVSGDVRIALTSISRPHPGEPYISVRGRTASGDIAVYRA
jgi:DUF4097 and DUF4098 domain-containing protein YvlB